MGNFGCVRWLLGPRLVEAATWEGMELLRRASLLKGSADVSMLAGNRGTGGEHQVGGCHEGRKAPHKRTGQTFAAMPPLEAQQTLFRQAALGGTGSRDKRWERRHLMFVDIKKAWIRLLAYIVERRQPTTSYGPNMVACGLEWSELFQVWSTSAKLCQTLTGQIRPLPAAGARKLRNKCPMMDIRTCIMLSMSGGASGGEQTGERCSSIVAPLLQCAVGAC